MRILKKPISTFFVQTDLKKEIGEDMWKNLNNIVDEMEHLPDIKCKVSLKRGNCEDAEKFFVKCHHYLITRTFRGMHFSCLADLMNMEILSGVDRRLFFQSGKIFKEH